MSSAIKTPAFQAKAGNIQNEDGSSIYSGGEWSFKNASAVTGFHVDADGKVGIGVTPSAWGYTALQIKSGAVYEHSSTDFRIIQNAFYAAGNTPKYINSGLASMYRQDAGVHHWYTAGAGTAGNNITWSNPMNIDSAGNVVIGPTSSANTNLVTITNSSTVGYGISTVCNSSNSTQRYFEGYSTSASAQKIAIYTDGNVRIASGSTYGNFSDARLKTNIVDATSKLNDICSLKVRNFGTLENPEEKYIGFIAQEFEQVFPGLVTTSTDLFKDGREVKGIKESALIPILVKSIQELSAKVDAQAAEIEALKAK